MWPMGILAKYTLQTDKGELFISGVENDSTHPAEPNSLYREFEWIILLLFRFNKNVNFIRKCVVLWSIFQWWFWGRIVFNLLEIIFVFSRF